MSTWMPLIVHDTALVARDVRSFTLVEPSGVALPEWTPGAHVDVRTSEGLVRQYSLCGDPADRSSYRVAVLLEPASRGGSKAMHAVAAGDVVEVSAPRNNFPLADATSYVFVAGGIGITPLLPMIAEASRRGADWVLHYGGRDRDSMAFVGELAAHGDRVRVLPQDEHGLLPLADIVAALGEGSALHSCGPEPMLAALESVFPASGPTLHLERFKPRDDVDGPSDAFEVELASTGETVPVEAGESIVDALRKVGVSVQTSCREGTCATCETTVLGGEVDHRDSVLTPAERAAGDTMMLCVSRARSPRLVLDL
ncbi:PDR/VanB family oxidoreductase [Actinosynnema sp. NPDC020468]|uniref:PDR/VanB family oxidoreductase n=1 Tax=Actinosynnema sp. NPDC020468 TaxID=3154488 RepID=UPI0033E6B62D